MTEERMHLEIKGMVAPICCPLLHGMVAFVLLQFMKKIKVFLVPELKDIFLPYGLGLCFAKSESLGYFICLSLAEVLALNILLKCKHKELM